MKDRCKVNDFIKIATEFKELRVVPIVNSEICESDGYSYYSTEFKEISVAPIVNSEICESDEYNYYSSKITDAKLDYIYENDDRFYLKSNDYEELIEETYDNIWVGDRTSEELYEIARNRMENLEWELVIILRIG